MTAAQCVRLAYWFVTRPKAHGVHAAVFDTVGRLILVRHTYGAGWRLPGGGMKRGESPLEAIRRELREDIGMSGHGTVRLAVTLEHRPEYRRGIAHIFVFEDAVLAPRQSLEIEETGAFPINAVPPGTSPLTLRLLSAIADGDDYLIWHSWRTEDERPSR
jgi:ADP-ribose pyrophosphatase YjhB (NUDIX family)